MGDGATIQRVRTEAIRRTRCGDFGCEEYTGADCDKTSSKTKRRSSIVCSIAK